MKMRKRFLFEKKTKVILQVKACRGAARPSLATWEKGSTCVGAAAPVGGSPGLPQYLSRPTFPKRASSVLS